MQLLMNLGNVPLLQKSRALALVVRPALQALVEANRIYIRNYKVPLLYEAGVRYQEEPEHFPCEEFAAIPVVLARKWGDCDDLAPWRVAELREQGERADIRLSWKKRSNGSRLYHVTVRRGDGKIQRDGSVGTIEDPSALLGMK